MTRHSTIAALYLLIVTYCNHYSYSIPSFHTSGIKDPLKCTEDAFLCWDNSTVKRNASINCDFNECPAKPQNLQGGNMAAVNNNGNNNSNGNVGKLNDGTRSNGNNGNAAPLQESVSIAPPANNQNNGNTNNNNNGNTNNNNNGNGNRTTGSLKESSSIAPLSNSPNNSNVNNNNNGNAAAQNISTSTASSINHMDGNVSSNTNGNAILQQDSALRAPLSGNTNSSNNGNATAEQLNNNNGNVSNQTDNTSNQTNNDSELTVLTTGHRKPSLEQTALDGNNNQNNGNRNYSNDGNNTSSPQESHLTGGWKPLANLDDKFALQGISYAFRKWNEECESVFADITSGEMQVVRGFNFRIIVNVKCTGNNITKVDFQNDFYVELSSSVAPVEFHVIACQIESENWLTASDNFLPECATPSRRKYLQSAQANALAAMDKMKAESIGGTGIKILAVIGAAGVISVILITAVVVTIAKRRSKSDEDASILTSDAEIESSKEERGKSRDDEEETKKDTLSSTKNGETRSLMDSTKAADSIEEGSFINSPAVLRVV